MDMPPEEPTLSEPRPVRAHPPYDGLLDKAPFDTLEQYYPCPPACVSRNLMTEDIPGAQGFAGIQDPKDPSCLNKPFPYIWLEKDELKKPVNMVTNRHISPLDPIYVLPSGPSLIPTGDAKKLSNRTVSMMLDVHDIPGAHAESYYAKPCRCMQPGDEIEGSKPKQWTWLRKRTYWGHNNDLYDIDIGKKQFGFVRERDSNPLDPLYPTEPFETHDMRYKRLKFKELPPRRSKTDVGERLLDKMYWRAEQLPNMCRHWGKPQPTENSVTYDVFRFSLEQFGFYCTDTEFKKLITYADPDKLGNVKYENFSRALKHCDGLELDIPRPLGFDVGFWGSPSCLGQGAAVIEPLAPYGRSTVQWSENEQLYNPLTGMPVLRRPSQKLPLAGVGTANRGWRYNYAEVLGRLQNEDRKKGEQQYEYFPTPLTAKKKLSVMPPSMPVRRVTLASADLDHRPSACQQMDSLPLADLATHTCEKPAEQRASLAALETAKSMGAMVAHTTPGSLRERQFSRFPPLNQAMYPVSNKRGSEVMWRAVAGPLKPFVPAKVRIQDFHRTQDIAAVRALVGL